MNNRELLELTRKISNSYFNREFKHKIQFNSRLRTTGGRYFLSNHNIDINPKMLTEYDMDTLIGVIKHELCHYHLHINGYGHQHRHKDFKILLKKVGGLRYAPTLKTNYKNIYVCQNCGKKYYRQRKINTSKYVCSHCHGKLKLIE